ncbi:MAG: chemotaxis protein CheD [Bacillota bacterium]
MTTIFIGIGELGATCLGSGVLRTYALSSCVAVIMLAPRKRAAGLLHVALPTSDIDRNLAMDKLGYFADTGVPALLRRMRECGCRKDDLVVKIAAGGAVSIESGLRSNIGGRNLEAVREELKKYGMGAAAQDVGGDIVRTVSVFVETGAVIISSHGKALGEL